MKKQQLHHERKKRPILFPGLVRHAALLGVTRQHLYYVLKGQRHSPRIEAHAAAHMQHMRPREQGLTQEMP